MRMPVAVLVALARLLHTRPLSLVRSVNPQASSRRYTICTDIQFDTVDNVVVAMFELPGVKKTDVRISLATCPFSRAKQLTVSGSSRCALATERGHTILERKFGDFAKSICVPPETQVRRVWSGKLVILRGTSLAPRRPRNNGRRCAHPEDTRRSTNASHAT